MVDVVGSGKNKRHVQTKAYQGIETRETVKVLCKDDDVTYFKGRQLIREEGGRFKLCAMFQNVRELRYTRVLREVPSCP